MQIKIHKSYRNVVAICDTELLGKYFEEGKFQLDLKESFYKGDELNEEDLLKAIEKLSIEDSTFNIAGEKSTNAAIKAGIINPESIGKIAGIPFALVLI